MIEPKPGIARIDPYVAGANTVPGVSRIVKLASNESALGPSPRALEAAAAAIQATARYPDPSAEAVRQALSAHYGLDASRIVTGAGSEYLLDLVTRCFAGPGDEVLFPEVSFPLYRILAHAAGATPVEAPVRDFTADVDALLAAVTERTRVVFLANPNNPTGTWIGREAVERLHAGLPDNVVLVLDSAYAEYVEDPAYTDGAQMVDAHENIVMTRTFSKMFGLASLRLGWAYGSPRIVDAISRPRLTFIASGPAQAAAVAALEDVDHTAKVLRHNNDWLAWMRRVVESLDYRPTDSAANFVFFQVPEEEGGAAAADAFLKRRGIISRLIGPANALRVTVGLEAENRAFVDALTAFRGESRRGAGGAV